MKKYLMCVVALFILGKMAMAQNKAEEEKQTVKVSRFLHVGPIPVTKPMIVDTIDVFRKSYDASAVIDLPVDLAKAKNGTLFSDSIAPGSSSSDALHLLQFTATSIGYTDVKIQVDSLSHYQIYVDNKRCDGSATFIPGTHEVVVKYVSTPKKKEKVYVSLVSKDIQLISLSEGKESRLSLANVMNGRGFYSVEFSPSGRYLLACYRDVAGAANSVWKWRITDLKTHAEVAVFNKRISWVPGSDAYAVIEPTAAGSQLVSVDVATGRRKVIAPNFPFGFDQWFFPAKGDNIVCCKSVEGPADDADVHQYVTPDDRQPGWRSRNVYYKYDIATGSAQQLTFGYRSTSLADLSRDGRYALFFVNTQRLTQRPTTLNSLIRLDLQTMETKTLVEADGFISEARFSPDARSVVVKGSPEAFGGVGMEKLPEGRTPSMYDYQLFVLDVATLNVTPLTAHFNPSIENYQWNPYDGKIYFTALDRDYQTLFRADAKTGKIERLPLPEEYVSSFSLSEKSSQLAFFGQSTDNKDRLYLADTRSLKTQLLEDASAPALDGVKLGTCQSWDFVNANGDTIYGRYYLPPHFDSSRQYPLIVYYYGGCSPTSRYFTGNYPFHLYAAQGYVVYVLQPSGSAGFGQEFASRHANTAGEGPAQDIIEGTKRFCQEHGFVDSKKVGCLGASYGGFMTQYLQTKTDIFAAAVSHAGISDHTSYWGEGYWGYSYSEVSMANSYPWTRKDLYVDRSPLYNADKIHTPLLFLHGTVDTNVPIGESIQMYTALRLLGRPTAFVVVEGQDHHITDYAKRVKWQNTIFAWFAKWLQDDDSWWKSMYDKMPE